MALIAVSFIVYAAYLKWFRDSLPPALEILVLCITISLPLFVQNTLMKRRLAPYRVVGIERVPGQRDKVDNDIGLNDLRLFTIAERMIQPSL